jgi:hypothetical protein
MRAMPGEVLHFSEEPHIATFVPARRPYRRRSDPGGLGCRCGKRAELLVPSTVPTRDGLEDLDDRR